MRKLISLILIVVLAFGITGCGKSEKESAKKETTKKETTTQETTAKPEFTIQMHFVGDLLCATDARTSYENCFNDVADSVDPSYFLSEVSFLFKNDDITIGDAENVYSNKDLPISEKGQTANPGIEAYWFKTKTKNARILSEGGIDYVSIDNNHIEDYGEQGVKDTKKALDKVGVDWGEQDKIVYYEKDGYTIGVIGITMYNENSVPAIKKHIKKASKESDYQIVYFHGGTEAIHTPEEWKKAACHKLIDAGADLVIGDHPHVLQPREFYKGKTIIYSMGNFVFGGNRHPENRTMIYQHTLTIDNGKMTKEKGKIIPCYVYTGSTNNWKPKIITNSSERRKVKRFMNGKTDSPL